ncbi:Hsp20/alpha crystallin family protein [Desulfovibrio sp. OttesenSCG-928-G15]|nr:Hsp20/alpha crystallin family protein [Desulfovibrio sp. OttesenSCG-928-G15]
MYTHKRSPWNSLQVARAHSPALRTHSFAVSPPPLYMELDRIFDGLVNGYFPSDRRKDAETAPGEGMIRPNLDISGDDRQYFVTVEVPGVNENDLLVEVENGTLVISGEKKYEHSNQGNQDGQENGRRYIRLERSFGSFRRVLQLPDDVDGAAITASCKDGLLAITLPRKEEAVENTRRIDVNRE